MLDSSSCPRRSQTRRRGSTLILVLIVGTLLGFAALMTAGVALHSRKMESVELSDTSSTYRCEAAAELLRLDLINHWESTLLMPAAWFNTHVRQATNPTTAEPPRADGTAAPGCASPTTYVALPGVQARVALVGGVGQNWVEIEATTTDVGTAAGDIRARSAVRYRLNWGNNPIFDLAMLTEKTDCMFCHMTITGDVGSIGFFRPGWGNEGGSGSNSGNNSFITGDVFVAPNPSNAADDNITNDQAPTLNGTQVSGTIHTRYSGPKLPVDGNGDGKPDFPPVDVDAIRSTAQGSIWAGEDAGGNPVTTTGLPSDPNNAGVWVVPHGSTYSSGLAPADPSTFTANGSLGHAVEGNMILVGTEDKPIRLDGDVLVTGDVIIKGYVEGKGAIYAGRNVYIAGDIVYKTTPDTWPLSNDAEAIAAIQSESTTPTSELRLAARSNIVIGDWTYAEDRGLNSDSKEDDALPQRDRQGEMFMYDQFDLHNDQYFLADHSGSDVSSEVKKVGTKYFNDQGDEVTDLTKISRVNDNSSADFPSNVENGYNLRVNKYDSVIAPGYVQRDNSGAGIQNGTFKPWMSQAEFRAVLGTQMIENAVSRTSVGAGDSTETKQFELGPRFADWTNSNRFVADKDDKGTPSTADDTYNGNGRLARSDGKIVDVGPRQWSTQVRHIDAFLYANKRVGGTSRYAMTINGGIAAGEIGVLAVYTYNGSYINRTLDSGSDPSSWLLSHQAWMNNPPDSALGDEVKRLHLNYDYRLRNGGFGFNLIEGGAGELIAYRRGLH